MGIGLTREEYEQEQNNHERELQELREKIINLGYSLTIKDYLIMDLQMKIQALEYKKETL